MLPSPNDYLRHILDETQYLLKTSSGLTRQEFLQNETFRRAFVRSLEIIGEATKNLSSELRSQYSAVAWRPMAGMRDRLIHGYFGVDYEIVWDVVCNEIPMLDRAIREILAELNTQ